MGALAATLSERAGVIQLLATPAAGYAGCCAAIRDMALIDALGGIRVPTLVIVGSRDVSTPFKGHGELIAADHRGLRIALPNGRRLGAGERSSQLLRRQPGSLEGILVNAHKRPGSRAE